MKTLITPSVGQIVEWKTPQMRKAISCTVVGPAPDPAEILVRRTDKRESPIYVARIEHLEEK